MENLRLSVSDCVAIINQTLEFAYPSVVVVGEIASFKVNQGKYVFFDIKDEQASLNCFMMVYQLRQPLENGMKVEVVAQPKLTPWGKFSLTVREVRPVGEGSLKRAFELLVKKLQKEGLFDPSRKRRLPTLPSHIGVISSVDAAGYKDFLRIVEDRWGGLQIEVANVQVQGAAAPRQIVRALEHFNEMANPPEVIVIIRGGGSADDLGAFNDEPLARAIAASRVPTLVGIGHEVDTTLACMVADVRAATPSNAAQLLVPDKQELITQYNRRLSSVARVVTRHFDQQRRLAQQAQQRALSHLERSLRDLLRTHGATRRTLRELHPSRVLRRGYALVRDDSNVVIRDGDQLAEGQIIMVELEKSIIKAGVQNVDKK